MKNNFLYSVGCCSLLLLVSNPSAAQEEHDDEHHHLEEVIVSALPIERTVEQLAQPTSLIDGDELARRQAASIGESLANELGVSASYFGPVASRPIIRGQGGERVVVLSNGIDSLDASALSEDHATSTDSILADRIEVVRGPATLLYGSGAAGGIVNVVDRKIYESKPDTAVGGTASVGTDSATGKRSIAAKAHWAANNWVAYADIFDRQTDNVSVPGFVESQRLRDLEAAEGGDEEEGEEEAFGAIENTDSETNGVSLALTWLNDEDYFGASINRYETNYGIPGDEHHGEEDDDGGAEEEEEEGPIRIDLEQTRIDVRGAVKIDRAIDTIKLSLANNRYQHIEFEGAEVGTVFENDAYDLRVDLKQREGDRLNGSFGIQLKSKDFSAVGDEAFVPSSKTDQRGIYAFEEYVINDEVVLQGSARVEHQSIDTADQPSFSDTAFGFSIGSLWAMTNDIQLSANASFTQRHPNATELYADGPHLAVQRFERGSVVTNNGILDKEFSTNLDLTLRGDQQRFHWTLTGFINDINDYILLSPTDDMEDGLQVFEYTQTDATLYGVEAELLFDLRDTASDHLHARFFTDFVQAEQNNGDYLPRIPPLRVGAGLHFTRERLDISTQATYHSEQDNTAQFELATDSYTLLQADISYKLANLDMLIFARLTNTSDDDARRHTSPLKEIAPLPGRSVQLGWRWDF